MVGWFYSSNLYTTNQGLENLYNTGIYNGYVIQAIKEWNEDGLNSFCNNININQMNTEFFCSENRTLYLNKSGWGSIKGINKYSDTEIMDAMILLLGGEKGIVIDGVIYNSSLDNVTDIDPNLFSICINEINNECARNTGDLSIQYQWAQKYNGYKEEKTESE